MGRVFNTTGVCIPEKHYMVNINGRLQQIRELVDAGKYFTITSIPINFVFLIAKSLPKNVNQAKATKAASCAQLMGKPAVLKIAELKTNINIPINNTLAIIFSNLQNFLYISCNFFPPSFYQFLYKFFHVIEYNLKHHMLFSQPL